MVYGSNLFHNIQHGTNVPQYYTIDKSQLSIFKHRHDLIVAFNDSNEREHWWLRDVVSSTDFARVSYNGTATADGASESFGVRPAFLIY